MMAVMMLVVVIVVVVIVGVARGATLTECPLYGRHSVKHLIGITSFISSNKLGRMTDY